MEEPTLTLTPEKMAEVREKMKNWSANLQKIQQKPPAPCKGCSTGDVLKMAFLGAAAIAVFGIYYYYGRGETSSSSSNTIPTEQP